VLLEFNVERLGLLVDATVKILVVVGELLLLLVLLHPFEDLVLHLPLLGILSLDLRLAVARLGQQDAALQTEDNVLVVLGHVKGVHGSRQFVLVGQLESVRFVHFQVVVEGSSDETRTLVHHMHPAYSLLVVAGRKQLLPRTHVPQRDLVTPAGHEGQLGREEVNGLQRLLMMELNLRFLMHSEVEETDVPIVTCRKDVVVLQSLDALDII
jgi:hypothetical protein